MKFLIPLLLLTTACAHNDKLSTDTAGIVAIQIDGEMRAFVFISDHGKALPVPAEQCGADEHCMAMVKRYDDTGRTKVLRFSGQSEEEGHELPHRPLHEIDLQGHESADCPEDTYRESLPLEEGGLFLLCRR